MSNHSALTTSDYIKGKLFSINEEIPNINNSVVSVITRNNRYLPVQDEHFFSIRANLYFALLYTFAWIGMSYLSYSQKNKIKFLIGYLFGLCLLIIEIWTYNTLDWVYVNNQNLRAYSVAFPNIKNIEKGQLNKIKDDSELLTLDVGDYKIMLENNIIPAEDNAMYFLPAKTYLKYQNDGHVISEDLGEYLDGQFKHEYGYSNQDNPVFSSQIEVKLSNAAFYIVIICVTWALYTSHTNLATDERMVWLVAAVGLGLLTGGLMYNSGTLKQRMSFLYIMRRFLILTISFAVTAVLI